MSKFAALIGLMAICIACESGPKETPIARVVNDYLYLSDLEDVVASGALQADSIEAVQAYIHNWIQQKLLVRKAEKNLSGHQKSFEQEIENYRNSLVIFAYQNALIEQALDTVVTEAEIRNYYEDYKHQFLLKNNIVRVRFARLEHYPENSRDRAIRDKMRMNDSIDKLIFTNDLNGPDLLKLSDLCQNVSTNYHLDSDRWVYFNELLKEIPVDAYNQEEFLRRNSKFMVPDDNHIYCVNILEFRVKENFSPFDFEREKIRNIILNNRKIRIIESLRNEVMAEGQEKNWFEIY